MSLDDERAASNLGERLLAGVRNLWREVHRHEKILDHQSGEIELLKKRMIALEREMRGLRVSRGRAKAKSANLEAALSESTSKLEVLKTILN
jgi:hypothetical protein